MISKLARGFMIFVLVTPIVLAQSAALESSAVEKQKARDEREKKLLALVDEIITGSQLLTLPENRIRIDIGLAESIWPRDEKRAQALFKEAAASLKELTAAIDSGDPEYLNQAQAPQQLRQEMLQIAANHDPRLAIDFLRATRPTSMSRSQNSGLTNIEAQLEMRVANQIASRDPREALSVAEDSLKIGLDYEAMNLLYTLQSQNKALAEKFLEDILRGIRTYGIGNSSATPLAVNLLRTWIETNQAASDPAVPRTTSNLSLSNFNEATARELCNQIVNALLSNAPPTVVINSGGNFIDGPSTLYPGQMYGIFQQLKPMMPDIERLVPDRASALRGRAVEVEKSYEAQQGPWATYQQLSQSGTADALMEAARTAPAEVVDSLIQQAAWKAINQADDNRASQIVEKISDPRQRAEMKSQMVRQAFYRAREQKNISEARGLLSRLPSVEERATLLAQMAIGLDDKPAALQLLGEAESLLGSRALGYAHLQAQLQIANGYQALDASRSVPIVEKVVDRVNELVAAAVVLDGFDVQGYFRGGELIIGSGNPLNNMAQECGRALGSTAREELDLARSAAERFQRPEMRLIALLQIAQVAVVGNGETGAVVRTRLAPLSIRTTR